MNWLKKRLAEASTWAGLGMLIAALGQVFKADGMPEVGQVITQSAQQLATGDYVTATALIVGGLVSAMKAEKK